jgi:hypothetical protein
MEVTKWLKPPPASCRCRCRRLRRMRRLRRACATAPRHGARDRLRWCLAVPEHGAAGVYFPIDDMTLRYLRLTGRDEVLIRRVEAYAKCQMLWRYPDAPVDPSLYDEVIEFDLSNVEPSLAGPNRPEQRVSLSGVRGSFARAFGERTDDTSAGIAGGHSLANGDVVIAVITSCTNTANPTAMPVAGLLARNVARLGLKVKSLVKMSFAPGSVVVRGYMQAAGLQGRLDALGFRTAGARSGRRHCCVRDSRRCGSLRQSQFRGSHPSAGACSLSGIARSRHRLCARWHHHRSSLPQRRHQASQSGCGLSCRARRQARRFRYLFGAAREPCDCSSGRSGHVRKCASAQRNGQWCASV